MLVEGQTLEIKWTRRNREWYEGKGYVFTNYSDLFMVRAEDLTLGSSIMVDVICDYCGDIFKVPYGSYIKRIKRYPKCACKKCGSIKQVEISNKEHAIERYDMVRKICDEKGYKVISDISVFGNSMNKFEFVCPIHGVQSKIIYLFLKGYYCTDCGRQRGADKNRHTSDYVEKEINSINGNILLNKDEYVDLSTNNLVVLCGCCGKHTFNCNLASYRKGCNRCMHCSEEQSYTERKITQLLERNDINFEAEKRFEDCKDKQTLPFDFYLKDYNLLIEYDGEGHYIENFYNNRVDDTRAALEKTKYHDSIKNEYCKKNGIELLRIPYWEKKNVETIILNKLGINFA